VLNVYGQIANASDEMELFSTSQFDDVSFKTSEWTLATVSSPFLSVLGASDFRLIFEAKMLQSNAKVMAAIDDVSVSSGECRKLGRGFGDNWRLNDDCHFIFSECDFEEGLCGWHTEIEPAFGLKPDLVWELQRDQESNLVMEVPIGSTTPAGQIALLRSAEEMFPNDTVCLQFTFSVKGEDSGTLSVMFKDQSTVDFVPIWSSNSGSLYDKYEIGQVPIQPRANSPWMVGVTASIRFLMELGISVIFV
jgi:hypothetical protein